MNFWIRCAACGIVAALSSVAKPAVAQPPRVEYGALPAQSIEGQHRLLQVGSQTLLLRSSPNEIGVSVYGADHVLKTAWTLPVPDAGGYWPLRDAYSIGGRAVLFTHRQGRDKRISLHRIVLNEAGTAKESEDLIGSVPHISVMDRTMKRIGHLVDPYLSVVKDPYSDAYAAVIFNSLAGTAGDEDGTRLRILHFAATGGAHEKLTDAVYTVGGGDMPYADLISMAVRGREGVMVGVQEYFVPYRQGKGEENSLVYVGMLRAGASTFTRQALPWTEDLLQIAGDMRINPVTGGGQFLIKGLSDYSTKPGFTSKWKTHPQFSVAYLSESGTLDKFTELDAVAINAAYAAYSGSGKEFSGSPYGMFVHPDGTSTIVLHSTEDWSMSGRYTTETGTYFDHIGLVRMNDTGGTVGVTFLPLKAASAGYLSSLYLSQHKSGSYSVKASKKSFALSDAEISYYIGLRILPVANGGYHVVFNEDVDNLGKPIQKYDRTFETSEMTTLVYSFSGNAASSGPQQLHPGGPGVTHTAFAGADYSPATQTLVAFVVQRRSKEETPKIAWIKF